MPSARELRRGIAIGAYPDPAKERALQIQDRRAQVAEQGAIVAQQNAALAAQREARMAGNDDVRTRLDLLRFENEDVKARAAATAEARVLEDSINATKKLVDIPATTADFPMQLQKILTEHPRALADKSFQEQYQWNTGLHKEWLGQKQAGDKLAEEQRQKAADKLAIQEARKQSLAELGSNPKLKVSGATVGEKGEPSLTFKAVDETKTAPTITDINKRMKEEFGVELSQVNSPEAKMRQVDPTKPKKDEQWGTTGGSHYAFDVADKSGKPQTVLIPTDRFKTYADEYAQAKAGPGAAVQPPAPKQLDADTAKKLFEESGRDKEKARALAKERGFSF